MTVDKSLLAGSTTMLVLKLLDGQACMDIK